MGIKSRMSVLLVSTSLKCKRVATQEVIVVVVVVVVECYCFLIYIIVVPPGAGG